MDARRGGNSIRTAVAKGAISTAWDAAGARRLKAVKWFGSSRNYKTLGKALNKVAGKTRLKNVIKDGVKSYVVGKVRDRVWRRWR